MVVKLNVEFGKYLKSESPFDHCSVRLVYLS
jgi:hypothetical protein